MKILFAALSLIDPNGGVDQKITAQAEAMRLLGHQVVRLQLSDGIFFFEGGQGLIPPRTVKANPVGVYLGFQAALRCAIQMEQFDIVYTRHIFATPFQLATLHKMKKQGIFTIEEFPTYPYDAEFALFKSPVYKAAGLADRIFRQGYHLLLNLCVGYGRHSEIFGVPAVSIENGVKIDPSTFTSRSFGNKNVIRLVAVSAMTPAHGYERLLEGLAIYMQQRAERPGFFVDIVGDGACRAKWEALTTNLGIQNQVRFHGQLTGESLNDVLKQADIGIATLGWYKKGLNEGSELKIREYMARGLPFVYASQERLFSENDGFCLQVPNDDSALDMSRIIEFYNRLCSQPKISQQLLRFAQKHYTWEIQMNKVLSVAESMRKH